MHECEICGNTFEIEQAKESTDCGHRYCPFCGNQYDIIIIDEHP